MKIRFSFMMLFSLLTVSCYAQVFKCVENGKTVYSQQPCPTGNTQSQALVGIGTADPATFDIAGIKLGMTEAQAIVAITKNLGISKGDFRIREEDPTSEFSKWKTKEYSVKHKTGDYYFAVFERSDNTRLTYVTTIAYKMNIPEGLEKTKIRNDIIKKYGKPSTIETFNNIESLEWCGPIKSGEGCPGFRVSLSFAKDQLTLNDGKFTERFLKEVGDREIEADKLKQKY